MVDWSMAGYNRQIGVDLWLPQNVSVGYNSSSNSANNNLELLCCPMFVQIRVYLMLVSETKFSLSEPTKNESDEPTQKSQYKGIS